MELGGLIAALAACVLVQAFFAASEIAMVVTDESKLGTANARDKRETPLLLALLRRRERVLALTLTGANLATVIAASVLTTFLHHFGPNTSYLAPVILAPLTLLIGESLPKLLTFRHPITFARIAAGPLRLLEVAFWPLLEAETIVSRWLRKLAGVPAGMQSVFITREDLSLMIRSLGDQPQPPTADAILPTERQMISRIFRFKNAEARQAMVPLVRVEAVALETTLAEAAESARHTGFSRIPVFEGRIVNIVGVLHVFDLLEAPDLSRPVAEVMRQVVYFAESTPLDQILLTFQRTGQNLAVIVDEYGGAAGILTLEDLLEEIVGEIEEEHGSGEELVRVISPRALNASARATVTELNERFRLRLPESGEYATIGGLVVERLGHIPRPGEQVKAGEATLTVVRADARAVREILITPSRPLDIEQARRR
jgi:CBS domain containing-hemolysin-like protein